jgi:predicted O-linked N-acetylglucosamine transferase (SPINDLY family)
MTRDTTKDSPRSLLVQAIARHQAGHLADAEVLYRQVLASHPGDAEALHYLGLLGFQTGHLVQAEELLSQAARGAPLDPVVLNNWGIVLAKLGRLAEARTRFERAIERGPGYADALVNLANVLADTGEFVAAEERYRAAIAIAPGSPEAHNNLGKLLLARRRVPEAVACFEEALRANPRHASALNNLGNALRDQGRFKEAFDRYRAAQLARPGEPEPFSNLLLAMNCDPELSADTIFAAHLDFAARFERPLAAAAPAPATRGPGARLRIGYVSPDFRGHAAAAFIEPLLAHHDRTRFEVVAYYNSFVEDDVTRRIRSRVERFATVAALSDAQLAQAVRADGIDILVDLSGHTAQNRLLAFARRPAPVQATWLGYLNTTGLSAMDFRLTDAWADPPGMTERWHTEELIRLPSSLWCYQPWQDSPPVAHSPALAGGHVTFGSMNNPAKLNFTVLETWSNLLALVPASRLHLHLPDDPDFRSRVLAVFRGRGVDAERISFFPRLPVAEYLARHHEIDIALDTFPCSGGTTTFDALWMGVPVVSLVGDRPFSRGGASILGNLGFDAWLARTREEYVSRAAGLAYDVDALDRTRMALRDRLGASTLMDGAGFAVAVESAYATMWKSRGFALPVGF